MIAVRSLQKKIGQQEILRGVDLKINSGETLAIIGRSGGGKSVLLKHMVGLMEPDSGEIWIHGQNIIGMNERQLGAIRKKVGILFQGGALSGGMKKRVGLARAIIRRPSCVLYDEPTAGLDPVVADSINRLIRRLQQRFGMTSVVVTHDMKSAFDVADRIAYLHEGRIYFNGTASELQQSSDPLIQDFLLGRSDGGGD
ncbi:MAG: ABC transporter ATP-binding protein [Verrucomicrobia bacterium]|nr:MAG: ABC transporter ATP-binding protein [Verrucomicrobiota bacterium]